MREPSSAVPGLENDPDGQRIVAEELKLLATVMATLADAEKNAEKATATEDDALLLDLREQISVAKPEDLPALLEQMHNLGAIRAQRGKSASGVIDRLSPYFGHLRLEESYEGEKKPRRRDVLVGSKSYLDPRAGLRIVDWRNAPVSRIFYRYGEEEDYEETLGDKTVEGRVLARRSVAITDGVLRRVASPQGTFVLGKEGTWRRLDPRASRLVTEKRWEGGKKRLGVGHDGELRKDKELPAIAALLDKDQFSLITAPSAGLVAISGGAGSGKTTVGLHRVAFLAETDPGRFRPERMLVVVPNDALIHYTARVLPSLGVNGVQITTFPKWATRVVLDLYPKLPTKLAEDTPPVVSRAKSSAAMLRALAEIEARIQERIDRMVESQMAKWPEGEKVTRAFAKCHGAPDARVTQLSAWLAGKRPISKDIPPASDLPDVTRGAVEKLGHDLRKETRTVLATWDELTTNRELMGRAFEGEVGFGPGQLDQVHAYGVRKARVRQEGERDGEVPTLDQEDHALLLRIHQVLRGPLSDSEGRPLRVAHLFVDEVQDASPVELRVLIDLAGGAEGSITLSGDTAQRMLDDGDERGELDFHKMLDELGVENRSLSPLRVSYRSTAEITTFARHVLGPHAHEAEPIATRNGPPVELFSFASPGEAVLFLAESLRELARDEPQANVAIVARFPQQAQVYYEGLVRAEVPNVRRVAKQDFQWDAGFEVTDVRQTKGLEFDEVILLETTASSYPESSHARHALYVGATRAAHQLWCLSSEKPSPLVEKALAAMEEAVAGA
jgi:DNA helicase-2/ATP-dependent DNA helicase PcrA